MKSLMQVSKYAIAISKVLYIQRGRYSPPLGRTYNRAKSITSSYGEGTYKILKPYKLYINCVTRLPHGN
jgi:hypothetical protein